MQTIFLSRKEVARREIQLYKNSIRQQVETDENIGNMVIIDFESGDCKVDETWLKAARKLSAKHPHFRLCDIRIRYNLAVSFGGIMKRVYK